MTERITHFLNDHRPSTPCLVVDLDIVAENYRRLRDVLPNARIYYAIKANPAPEILRRLVWLGASFDAASVNEVEMAIAAGASPDRISFGNTIKKAADIAAAYRLGVRLFAFDSEAEMLKLAKAAPGARVFCRILTSGKGAEWPLSRKFGCHPEMARVLLRQARTAGLDPCGVSFHVGSQQRRPSQWARAVGEAARLFRKLEEDGIELSLLNIGGGLPTRYRRKVPDLATYAAEILSALRRHFGNRAPDIIAEPGRQLVGNAGMIQTEVVLISQKSYADSTRWVYLDIGKFGGLAETEAEAIQYPIRSSRRGRGARVVLAGPTCDSADVLYHDATYRLPNDLQIGDKLLIQSTGAYTSSYASVAFNGFEPLRCYCI